MRRCRRDRPLSDPKRAPYVRAVLDRKQRKREQEARDAIQRDPQRFAAHMAHLRDCLALVEDDEA